MKIKRLLLMLSLAVAIPWVANAQTTPILPQHGEIGNQDASLTTVTQTIALNAGVNWVSFNVQLTLDDLKSALSTAMPGTQMMIQGIDGYTSYNGTRWRGALSSLDFSRMYMITVQTAGIIEIGALPVDPTALSVTIVNGPNWIGFPLQSAVTVTDAFTNFSLTGDMVQGSEGYANYNGTRWRGSLTNLEPGKGYIYNSAATGERPFSFASPSKTLRDGNKK